MTGIKKSISLWASFCFYVLGKRRRRRIVRTCGGSWKSWSWGEEFRIVTASFPPKHGRSFISNQCSATGTPHLHVPCATYFTVHSGICLSIPQHQHCTNPFPLYFLWQWYYTPQKKDKVSLPWGREGVYIHSLPIKIINHIKGCI